MRLCIFAWSAAQLNSC